MEKTIRIWDGYKVIGLVSADQSGEATWVGFTGGAANSTPVDIEIDPFDGWIVDHGVRNSPVNFREIEE